jgi:hypothetical protein
VQQQTQQSTQLEQRRVADALPLLCPHKLKVALSHNPFEGHVRLSRKRKAASFLCDTLCDALCYPVCPVKQYCFMFPCAPAYLGLIEGLQQALACCNARRQILPLICGEEV